MTELNPPYIMRKILIDKNSIKNFIIDEDERRKLRNGKVKEILSGLNKSIHFNSPFVVNEKTMEKFDLIDGNHRIESLKLKIGTDKEFSIYVWCAVYRNLNDEDRRRIYKLWNLGTTQSSTDFLKAYWVTLPYGEEILKKLPVTIYGDKTHINVKLLVGSYINAKKQRKFEGGYGAGKEKVVSDFTEITPSDISDIKDFADFMKEVFGSYTPESLFYKSTPLSAFMRVWFDNQTNKKLVKIFKKEFAARVSYWEGNGKSGGREACNLFYDIIKTNLKRKYALLFDEDLIEIKEKEMEIIDIVKRKKIEVEEEI